MRGCKAIHFSGIYNSEPLAKMLNFLSPPPEGRWEMVAASYKNHPRSFNLHHNCPVPHRIHHRALWRAGPVPGLGEGRILPDLCPKWHGRHFKMMAGALRETVTRRDKR
jgi:hypothetical protein